MNHIESKTRDRIDQRASFDLIRYGQVWEDADVLREGLAIQPGHRVLSICSAGDNALAMLLDDPSHVLAVDLSPAQIQCLQLRMAAYRTLSHREFLELMGSRPSDRRFYLLVRCVAELPEAATPFWAKHRHAIIEHGLGGIGKFERYFRIFRKHVLPLVHDRSTVERVFHDSVLMPKSRKQREEFYEDVWNNRRWRWMLKLFFSNFVMGRLGRDPEFFAHVTTSLADQVTHRTRHAFVELAPIQNPYLHWILEGTHGSALPAALREENFEIIRSRLDRIEIHQGAIDSSLFERYGRFDAFNLSDIFEYMSPELFANVHRQIVEGANPGARLMYWNMLVPRGEQPMNGVVRLSDRAAELHARDKAFFYSAIRLEHVR